ncbi:MAG TPA: hypothetical protein VK866_06125 [Acidimicrobiales bacterium]|nr:hypothetical protein [Acidimicrobiales bacterium]
MQVLGARALTIVAGLLAAVALVVLGVTSAALDGAVTEGAVAELVRTEGVAEPLTDVLADAAAGLVAPATIDPSPAHRAAERALDDPDLVDVVGVALVDAHAAWVDGDPLVVRLAPGPTTTPLIGGIRDIDADLARAVPDSRVARPAAATIDVPTASDVRRAHDLARLGLVVALLGMLGAVAVPGDRARALDRIGRVVLVLGAGLAVVGLGTSLLGEVGADGAGGIALTLVAADRAAWLAAAGFAVVVGATAVLLGRHALPAVDRSLRRRARRRADDAPARTGTVKRAAPAARQAAMDAFFDPDATDAGPDDDGRADPSVDDPTGADTVADDDEVPRPRRPAPARASGDAETDARAAAREADRRAALERIDGTSATPLRTHLRR